MRHFLLHFVFHNVTDRVRGLKTQPQAFTLNAVYCTNRVLFIKKCDQTKSFRTGYQLWKAYTVGTCRTIALWWGRFFSFDMNNFYWKNFTTAVLFSWRYGILIRKIFLYINLLGRKFPLFDFFEALNSTVISVHQSKPDELLLVYFRARKNQSFSPKFIRSVESCWR